MPAAMQLPAARRRIWCAAGALWAAALLGACAAKTRKPEIRPQKPTAAAPPAPGALRLAADLRESLLARALMVVNTPYTSGGNTPQGGFDCSGLVQWAVGGITRQKLPRTTQQWAQASRAARLACADDVIVNDAATTLAQLRERTRRLHDYWRKIE